MSFIEADNNLINEAAEIIFSSGNTSVSLLQRRLNIGYSRAARLIDTLEELGVVGEFRGSAPRAILMSREQFFMTVGSTTGKEMVMERRRSLREIKAKEPTDFKVPFLLRAKQDKANSLLFHAKFTADSLNKSEEVSDFIEKYQEFLDTLEALNILSRNSRINLKSVVPILEINKYEKEFQLHLCDAIVRAKESVLEKIYKKYRNAKQYQILAYNDFLRDIKESEDYFGQDAYELAQKAKEEVAIAAGAELQRQQIKKSQPKRQDISIADKMEGLEFEGFCARLLGWNGFTNVEVTQASGDQGIDVLAQKDGIKYAIQCKCYSSDLGNTPVQEAYAGKNFYKCHIAAVMTNRYFTSGAKELAVATGVLLWDRDELQRLLDKAVEKDNK